jgi:tricorn protease-like protein
MAKRECNFRSGVPAVRSTRTASESREISRKAFPIHRGARHPTGYQEIALSPDDKRVAFARNTDNAIDIWLTDLERRMTSRFTSRPPVNNVPIWSPDGRQIIFASVYDGGLDLRRRAGN